VFVRPDDPLTLHRHPVAQSTDAARGRVAYDRGLHAWEIRWPVRQRGTHAVVGVATADMPLHSVGYHSLVGTDAQSWGWDIVRNKLFHDGATPMAAYPEADSSACNFTVSDEFVVVLDMDVGTLGFAADGKFLGIAFSGLRGKKLFPAVSCVWGHCEVTLRYIGGLDPDPMSLADCCRQTIRRNIGKNNLHQVYTLPLPTTLQNYLLYK